MHKYCFAAELPPNRLFFPRPPQRMRAPEPMGSPGSVGCGVSPESMGNPKRCRWGRCSAARAQRIGRRSPHAAGNYGVATPRAGVARAHGFRRFGKRLRGSQLPAHMLGAHHGDARPGGRECPHELAGQAKLPIRRFGRRSAVGAARRNTDAASRATTARDTTGPAVEIRRVAQPTHPDVAACNWYPCNPTVSSRPGVAGMGNPWGVAGKRGASVRSKLQPPSRKWAAITHGAPGCMGLLEEWAPWPPMRSRSGRLVCGGARSPNTR